MMAMLTGRDRFTSRPRGEIGFGAKRQIRTRGIESLDKLSLPLRASLARLAPGGESEDVSVATRRTIP
ncbi:MAG: hypothetical protein BGO16_08460 [Nitrobacter sp. 62-23]|nr:MAG: hypothetical protein BGO16_08460 [Nitrobacter sp. 62-23]